MKQIEKLYLKARTKADSIKEKLGEDKTDVVSILAIELEDGKIITGKKTELMDAPSATILNAIKYLAKLDDDLLMLSPKILEPILKLKRETLKDKNIPLDVDEILIALSISAVTNPVAELALSKLKETKRSTSSLHTYIKKMMSNT